MIQVPFADLYQQYLSLKDEIDGAIADVIRKSAFIRGEYVERFEEEFARAIGVKHCVSCANGTDSLYIAMRALGVRPGDEVITSAHSWIASSETVTQAGGVPVFCDTHPDSFTIDVRKIEEKITDRTVGIIPVHLYGQAADMDAIMEIAAKHRLWIIEDSAQAHLATYKGRPVGSFGHAGSFSFYPGKNLGAMGDAGALVCNDDGLARKMAMLARHGGLTKHDHEIEGVNSRLDGLQAAILSVKLRRLEGWTEARRSRARTYTDAFRQGAAIPPLEMNERHHVYHLYVVRHERRDALAEHLKSRSIQTIVNYPRMLPFLKAYERFGHRPADFPVATTHQSQILSLPLFPEMTDAQQDWVIDSVLAFGA